MEVTRVPVSLGERSYDVVIGERLLGEMREFAEAEKPTSSFIVTDTNVGPLHADVVQNAVVANEVFTVPAGENSKGIEQLARLYDEVFAARQVDRHSLVFALGGGMVGDLAGYLAATLLRGIRYVQVPTSLLAMVDSSVGGKTAINHAAGKNLIGAFHQPAAVFCDLHFLKTLPEREYVSAIAEIIKTAALSGDELMSLLEASADKLAAREVDSLQRVIEACVRFKAQVVAEDEVEVTGRRATLNLGHTLAHVIETAFPERYLHGEAVAIGTAAALRLSVERAKLDPEVATRVVALFGRFGLSTVVPENLEAARALEIMEADKKRTGHVLRFVVLSELGEAGALPCRLDDALAATLLGRSHA
ncbi:MAG: 3-dehydroquinate synthase [Planctomycetes bacterium]|nr:3-dehydroquinate synthase [Planctomycetota bacterium]